MAEETSEVDVGVTKFLLLPQDECFRKQYYQLATTLESASDDVTLCRASTLNSMMVPT